MKYLYQNKYWALNKEYNLDKLLYLMIDRPNYINSFGDFVWRNIKKQLHRNYDLLSRIFTHLDSETCSLSWDINGELHRENNKPAVIYYYGDKEYYFHNQLMKTEKL